MDPFPLPPGELTTTRLGLHRLAMYVIAPTRHAATGRFGLRSVHGGFGTPEFDGRRVRVEGDELIDERDGGERRSPITSIEAAAAFLGSDIDPDTAAEHDSPALGDTGADLGVDGAASHFLGRWFEVAFEALRRVASHEDSIDPSEPQLWPGHFDAAIEVGDENHRASYGASPGDQTVAEPYLYLAAWYPDRLDIDAGDAYWNGAGFTGRMLKMSNFDSTADPVEMATEFWLDARDRLHS